MIVDLPLVRRVEGTAARWMARQIDALRTVNPERGAHWTELDGGVLAAVPAARFINRGVGLGLGSMPPDELLDRLEEFYDAGGLPPTLEVCPWVPPAFVEALRGRGYALQWFRNVYVHPLETLPPPLPGVEIDPLGDDDVDDWMEILRGEARPGSLLATMSDESCRAMRRVPASLHLLAKAEGRAIACGSLTIVRGVGWFSAAATVPRQRGRGAQQALLVSRLRRARRDGCTLAAGVATPGSTPARNLERVGFRLIYTQAVLGRSTAP